MRFEKVSYNAFFNDVKKLYPAMDNKVISEAYDGIQIPERKTRWSAGYDISSPIYGIVRPREALIVPSGLKAYFSDQEKDAWDLDLVVRSSTGIKNSIFLKNTIGIIDPDYYNNKENEGDVLIPLYNFGDEPFEVHAGDRLCQGIFRIHGITSDDKAKGIREGGVGSTGI